MSQPINVVAILGSPRAPSYTRSLGQAVIRALTERGAAVEILDLRATPLPPMMPELRAKRGEHPDPEAARLFRLAEAADAYLLASPVYHNSYSGVLKNALDHASRPHGDSAWAKKPAGVIGTSQGATATAMAQQHLRGVLAYLDMPTMNQPEAFIRFTDDLIGPGGHFGEKSEKFADGWMRAFITWAQRHHA